MWVEFDFSASRCVEIFCGGEGINDIAFLEFCEVQSVFRMLCFCSIELSKNRNIIEELPDMFCCQVFAPFSRSTILPLLP
jgi:hypothetical protein